MTIEKRLKEERERIGLSQSRFGDLAKVVKQTVIQWEKGASSPDAVQLTAFAAAGVDVFYIITGDRIPFGVAQRRAAAYTPAERAGEEIHGMKLTEEDAAMVVALAKRLSIEKGE